MYYLKFDEDTDKPEIKQNGVEFCSNDSEYIEQIKLPAFKKSCKVKIRIKNAGRLQPSCVNNNENV